MLININSLLRGQRIQIIAHPNLKTAKSNPTLNI
jgi:hypothetical protein